ncbi:MAG: hypothetical protein GY870_13285 [archaeon]|nr:hypothetical protein [archaeon]
MNAIDRVLKSINHEEPDRIPSLELSIDNLNIIKFYGEDYIFTGIKRSIAEAYDLFNGDADALTEVILRRSQTRSFFKNIFQSTFSLYKKIGLDLYIQLFNGSTTMPTYYDKDYFIDELGKIWDFKLNPSDGMDLLYYREGIYKNFEEYEAGIKPDPDNPRREKYFKAFKKTQIQHQDEVYGVPALWSLFEHVWQSFGFSNFSKLLRRPSEAKKVFDDSGKFSVKMVKRIIDWGESNLLMLYDDFGFKSGLLVSPKHYRMYVFPWMKEMCRIAHKAGLKVLLHSCGDISLIFEDLINLGIDGFHPIEATTANPDFDIFKLNKKYGDKITLIGNLSPQKLATGSAEFIRNYTKKLIKEVAPGGGYIMSSGHSINPQVTLDNYLLMQNTLKKYGEYPINVD